ncbi:hypothetical protein [Caldicellulosiruptor saccharolyticus]|uniref:hypothetical protein n=1 Tax=Caldicellulosiruptor saccharolyticus TaxID=44001 RepID=UPI0038B9C219
MIEWFQSPKGRLQTLFCVQEVVLDALFQSPKGRLQTVLDAEEESKEEVSIPKGQATNT